MLLTLMLTSKGVAGVPRASLVILAGTLASYDLPLEGVTLILGVDDADGHGAHDDQRRSATAWRRWSSRKWEGEFNEASDEELAARRRARRNLIDPCHSA